MREPESILENHNVAVYHDHQAIYPTKPPFSPAVSYPEYPLGDLSNEPNRGYDAVRGALQLLGLDAAHFGTDRWNPLGEIIRPGDTVVIKPNFVLSSHEGGGDLFSVITHPSVLRAVVDYTYVALGGRGRIIIADAPQMDCDFNELLARTQIESIRELYRRECGFPVEILDLRRFWLDRRTDRRGYAAVRRPLPGDPRGDVLVNLGPSSLFYGKPNHEKFYGADYDRKETIRHHSGDTQAYVLSRTILAADVVISVPKLKVHKKVGVTLNMKGLVGTATNKNCLVHYTLGTPEEGGDQFPPGVLGSREKTMVKLQRWLYDKFLARKDTFGVFLYELARRAGRLLGARLDPGKAILDAGNWYGNDSAWRMVIDLLRIFLYADENGVLHNKPVRRVFSVVDGIVAGEGNGPLAPDSKSCGVIVAGRNPCAVDIVCTRLMGFDYRRIKMLSYVADNPALFRVTPTEIIIKTNNDRFENILAYDNRDPCFAFLPHPGWQGQVEVR